MNDVFEMDHLLQAAGSIVLFVLLLLLSLLSPSFLCLSASFACSSLSSCKNALKFDLGANGRSPRTSLIYLRSRVFFSSNVSLNLFFFFSIKPIELANWKFKQFLCAES